MKILATVEYRHLPLRWAIVDVGGRVVALFHEQRFAASFFQSNHALGLEKIIAVVVDDDV